MTIERARELLGRLAVGKSDAQIEDMNRQTRSLMQLTLAHVQAKKNAGLVEQPGVVVRHARA